MNFWRTVILDEITIYSHGLATNINQLRTVTAINSVLFKINNVVIILDMNVQDHVGNTPLHLAVENDALQAADYLLSM